MTVELREGIDGLLEALRRSAEVDHYPLSPRVERELLRVEAALRTPGETAEGPCPGSGQLIWRDGSKYHRCDDCGQKFQDFMTFELVSSPEGWRLPHHTRRVKR